MDDRWQHGTPATYKNHDCRCDACVIGYQWFNRERRTSILSGELPKFAKITGAACRGSHAWEIPELGSGDIARTIARAVAACQTCPVLEPCRDWIVPQVEDPCPYHVVAGWTPTERRIVRLRWLGIPA